MNAENKSLESPLERGSVSKPTERQARVVAATTEARVVNKTREPFDIYIGRPSKWGNPFQIGNDGTREEVVTKYREWIVRQPVLLASLTELRGKVLGCYCAPQACHGDVLAALANSGRLPCLSCGFPLGGSSAGGMCGDCTEYGPPRNGDGFPSTWLFHTERSPVQGEATLKTDGDTT